MWVHVCMKSYAVKQEYFKWSEVSKLLSNICRAELSFINIVSFLLLIFIHKRHCTCSLDSLSVAAGRAGAPWTEWPPGTTGLSWSQWTEGRVQNCLHVQNNTLWLDVNYQQECVCVCVWPVLCCLCVQGSRGISGNRVSQCSMWIRVQFSSVQTEWH